MIDLQSQSHFRMICCRAGGQEFWIDTQEISTVQQASSIRDPNSDDGSMGFIRMLGKNIPVYNLVELLGLESQIRGSHVLMIDTADGALGLVVENASRVFLVPMDRCLQLPTILSASGETCFRGVIAADRTDGSLDSRMTNRLKHTSEEMALLLSVHKLACDVEFDTQASRSQRFHPLLPRSDVRGQGN